MNTAIVQRAEQSEEQLIREAREAISLSAWTVGKVAHEWTERFARGRSDGDFGMLVGLSREQVAQRRLVWIRFGKCNLNYRFPKLSWTHFNIALGWEDAEACLSWANQQDATVAEMRVWRRAQRGEDLFTDLEPEETTESILEDAGITPEKPVAEPQRRPHTADNTPREVGQRSRVPVPESRNTATARSDRTQAAEESGKPASVPVVVSREEIQRLLDRFDADKDRRKQAAWYFARAVQLDHTLKPKVPTVSELIGQIPDEMTGELRQAATDWAEYKQSLTAGDRIRSLKAWQIACRQMQKYPPGIVCEAIETAIANCWAGWLQDSVKQQVTGRGRGGNARTAGNDAAFREVFGE